MSDWTKSQEKKKVKYQENIPQISFNGVCE